MVCDAKNSRKKLGFMVTLSRVSVRVENGVRGLGLGGCVSVVITVSCGNNVSATGFKEVVNFECFECRYAPMHSLITYTRSNLQSAGKYCYYCVSLMLTLCLFNHRLIFIQADFCKNLLYLKIVCVRCSQLMLR